MANEIAAGSVNEDSIRDRHVNSAAGISRSKLESLSLLKFPQRLEDLRVWDALGSLLPTAGASDDLGLITGTFGSGPPQVQTGDLKAAGSTTRRARIIITLPDSYQDGLNVQIRCRAGMKTTVADTSATIDIEAYQLLDDGTISADLCTTSATTINSLTYADKDFTITGTTLVAGSRLDVRISILVNDAATVTAVIGLLQNLTLRCDARP